jgi:hypothetical protein
MNTPELLEALTPLVEGFEQLGIPYHIGGSVASSLHGIPRSTLDIDCVAAFRPEQVRRFVELLEASYYVDEGAVREALRYHRSFNAIHLATMIKIDVFLPPASPFNQQAFQRVKQDTLETSADARRFYFASAEDSILKKLEWYQMGGRVSDQQWKDVLGILKVQGAALDVVYLRRWAATLQVGGLLEQALEDAGLTQ